MTHGCYASAFSKIQGCLTAGVASDNAKVASWAVNTFSANARQVDQHAEVLVAGGLVDMVAAMANAMCAIPTEGLAQTFHVPPNVCGHGAAQIGATSEATWLQTHEQCQVRIYLMPQLDLGYQGTVMSTDVQAADMALATIAKIVRQIGQGAESSFRSHEAACNASIPLSASTLHWSITHASPCATAQFLRELGKCGWLDKLPAAPESHPWASTLLWNLQSETGLHALAMAVAESSCHGEENTLWVLAGLLDRTLRSAGMTSADSCSHVPVYKHPCQILLTLKPILSRNAPPLRQHTVDFGIGFTCLPDCCRS